MSKIKTSLSVYWAVPIVIFVILFFGKLINSGMEYKNYKAEFKIKCENRGGVMFVPSGVKGWPKPECRNPDSIINIDD